GSDDGFITKMVRLRAKRRSDVDQGQESWELEEGAPVHISVSGTSRVIASTNLHRQRRHKMSSPDRRSPVTSEQVCCRGETTGGSGDVRDESRSESPLTASQHGNPSSALQWVR